MEAQASIHLSAYEEIPLDHPLTILKCGSLTIGSLYHGIMYEDDQKEIDHAVNNTMKELKRMDIFKYL